MMKYGCIEAQLHAFESLARCRCMVMFMLWPLYCHVQSSLYPLNRMLDVFHSHSKHGGEERTLTLPGMEVLPFSSYSVTIHGKM